MSEQNARKKRAGYALWILILVLFCSLGSMMIKNIHSSASPGSSFEETPLNPEAKDEGDEGISASEHEMTLDTANNQEEISNASKEENPDSPIRIFRNGGKGASALPPPPAPGGEK